MSDVLRAFIMTLFAGLATGLGSFFIFIKNKDPKKMLGLCLGFSAGIMIYLSMIEIFPEAQNSLKQMLGEKMGAIATVLGFFGGMILIALIDKFVPKEKKTYKDKKPTERSLKKNAKFDDKLEENSCDIQKHRLMRIGILTAISIAIHNFPEGIASFVAGLQSPTLAIPIVFAIAIHNIPEGISVAMPIYYGTGDKKKAIFLSFLSGLAEPLGAIIAYLILMPFLNEMIMGIVFAIVAGIMVYISFEELLPTAREYGGNHLAIYGLVAGMAVMAISIIVF